MHELHLEEENYKQIRIQIRNLHRRAVQIPQCTFQVNTKLDFRQTNRSIYFTYNVYKPTRVICFLQVQVAVRLMLFRETVPNCSGKLKLDKTEFIIVVGITLFLQTRIKMYLTHKNDYNC